jgi:hypothetical protein
MVLLENFLLLHVRRIQLRLSVFHKVVGLWECRLVPGGLFEPRWFDSSHLSPLPLYF